MPVSPKKVLVIEDDKPMAHAMELKLNHEGIETKSVVNGELGLDLIEKEKFDLVMLDLMMPKCDGFKVLKTMKERKIKTPVVVLSNLSQSEDEKRVLELGAVGFFVKSNTPIAKIVAHVKEKLKV